MNLANIRMLELAAEQLGEVVFIGGATVEFWITDRAAPEFRPTDDVDENRWQAEAFHTPSRLHCLRAG